MRRLPLYPRIFQSLPSRLQATPGGQDGPKHGGLSVPRPTYLAHHDRLRPPLEATSFLRPQRLYSKEVRSYPSRHEARPLKHDRDSPRRFPTPLFPTNLPGSGLLPTIAIPRIYSGPQTRPSIISQRADKKVLFFENYGLSTS